MPEKLQQYTTYEQSLELKDLGARQLLGRFALYWWNGEILVEEGRDVDGGDYGTIKWQPRLCDEPKPEIGRTIGEVRAFTFQEMFYELAQHYPLTLQLLADSAAGLTIHTAKNDHLLAFYSADRDPFRAVYAAFKWHLQQQSLTKKQ